LFLFVREGDQLDVLTVFRGQRQLWRRDSEWRPVSQKPMHTLRYQVVLQHGQRFPAVDHVVYDAMSGWASPDAIYWRPIPPLPPAPPQEPTP